MHAAREITLRHFLMQDAAAGGHPLQVARAQHALVAQAVAMLDGAGQHIGDRLDAAMRMPREAADVVHRLVVAEIIHHQEGVGHRRIAEAEDAVQLDAGAFHGRRGAALMLDGADGHSGTSSGNGLLLRWQYRRGGRCTQAR